jgi:Secretion system C-terminal sorting domain
MIRTRSFILFLLLCSYTSSAHAQWTTTNGPSGKEIVGLTTIASNIFAASDDGVFQWTGDTMWTQAGLTGTGVQSLLSNGSFLIAGTLTGVCVSSDYGNDWAFDTGGMSGQYVFTIAFSDTNLVAGTDNGVFISNSNGASWEQSNFTDNEVFSFATAGPNLVAGTEGISISTDNGLTWNAENNALSNTDVYALAGNENELFAGTSDTGVFVSTDNGATWNAVNNGLTDSTIYAFQMNGPQMFVGTDSGVFLSTNNGANWLNVNNSFTEYFTGVYSFCMDDSFLYAGSGGGVWKRLLNEFNGVTDGVQSLPAENANTTSCSVYPNPFTQSTTISFTSPESGDAKIMIVNILGAQVAQLFSGELTSGVNSFIWNPSGLPPGMYECIVQMNDQVQRVPVILAH